MLYSLKIPIETSSPAESSAELLRVGAALVVGEVQEARHALSQAVGDLVHPEEATEEAEPARSGTGGYEAARGSI